MSNQDAINAHNAQAAARNYARCDDGGHFEQHELGALQALWHAKANKAILPARAAFDMRTLKPFIEHVALLDCIGTPDKRRYRVRLFGTELARTYGERTGCFLDEVIAPADRLAWESGYELILTERRPLRFVMHHRSEQLKFLRSESLGAPLASNGSDPDTLLFATYFSIVGADPSIAA